MSYDGDGGGFQGNDDYNDVAARLVEFREKHPNGSLRPLDPAVPYRIERVPVDVMTKDNRGKWVPTGEYREGTFIVYVAAAYRTPDDPLPGVGAAWEPVPGRTQFTRNSELMNAETSAWGRAMVAALAADTKRGVASAQEHRNRSAEQDEDDPTPDRMSSATWLRVKAVRDSLNSEQRDRLRVWAVGEAQIPLPPLTEAQGMLYVTMAEAIAREPDPNADPPHGDAGEEPQDGPQPSLDELRDQIAAVQRDGTTAPHDGPVAGLGSPEQLDDAVPPPATDGPVETWECDGPDRHAIKGPRGSKCPMPGCGGFLGPEEPF